MRSKRRATIHLFAIRFVIFASAVGLPFRAVAEKPGRLQVALYYCLTHKFPGVSGQLDRGLAGKGMFDPASGRNFGCDANKQAWVDTKTGECICPECPPSRTAQPQPTPSTTDKVTDVLKTIGSSVSIGIGGGGGGDQRHHGEERHRTADKVSTDKTKTHKISPTTTHKTVTSACKCHPCNCAPCTCH